MHIDYIYRRCHKNYNWPRCWSHSAATKCYGSIFSKWLIWCWNWNQDNAGPALSQCSQPDINDRNFSHLFNFLWSDEVRKMEIVRSLSLPPSHHQPTVPSCRVTFVVLGVARKDNNVARIHRIVSHWAVCQFESGSRLLISTASCCRCTVCFKAFDLAIKVLCHPVIVPLNEDVARHRCPVVRRVLC